MPNQAESQQPRDEERAAFIIAERVLGVTVQPLGRSAPVDASLTYPSGRSAAFEVTYASAPGAMQLGSLLGRTKHEWPNPGAWWWSIDVGSPRDYPRLRACYARLIWLCEAADVTTPDLLWQQTPVDDVDADLLWLVLDSHEDTSMLGYPGIPKIGPCGERNVMVTAAGRGGIVDLSLSRLTPALAETFAGASMARHLDKVARANAEERHLFLWLHASAFYFDVLDAIVVGTALPPEPPPLPPEITHLWLAPTYGRRVLLWSDGQWQAHDPYDVDC